MNKTSQKPKIAALSLAGLLLLPFFAPASAATEGGGFSVKAQDIGDPTIVGQAGMTPTAEGGDFVPVIDDGDEAEVIYGYTCGPMSFDVTRGMINDSQRNWSNYKAGNYSAIDSGQNGVPILIDVELQRPITVDTRSIVVDGFDPAESGARLIVGLQDFPNNCSVSDQRDLSLTGEFIGYGINRESADKSTYGSKVVDFGGELFIKSNHNQTVDGRRHIESHTIPVVDVLTQDANSGGRMDVAYIVREDWYNYPVDPNVVQDKEYNIGHRSASQSENKAGYMLRVVNYADGSTAEIFNDLKYGVERRPGNGPLIAKWDNSGNFIAVGTYKSGNYLNFTPTTLSAWNSANGSSWDGKPMGIEGIKGTEMPFELRTQDIPEL